MKHLATFEAAANSVGIDPKALPVVTGLPELHAKAVLASYKLFIINQASWQGKPIDWNDYRQHKYYPWFDLENYDKDRVGSASGFSYHACGYGRSGSHVGSRLVYPSRVVAEYVGKKYIDLYRDLMVVS